jgi:N-succinyldiaminopimelate aminotransferase
VFDGEHVPLATFPGMRERTIVISSAGKTFSFTGWKVGWVCSTEPLVDAVRTAKQFLTYVNAGPFQLAAAVGLELPDDRIRALAHDLRERRDLLSDGLAQLGFEVMRPSGTYFVTTDVRPLGVTDALSFCRGLPRQCGVVAVPSSVFYDDPSRGQSLVRWAFCKRPEVLEEALVRLKVLARPSNALPQ